MPDNRICLFFSDTGGGHRSASEAIQAAIEEITRSLPEDEQPQIYLENVVEKSHPLNRWFVDLYNYLLRHHQARMKYYYWVLQYAQPNKWTLAYHLVAKYAHQLLRKCKPSVIVSVHPMSSHYLARTLKEMGLTGKVKLITVITDPNDNLWTGWACPDSDLIIAPNDLAANKLIELGCPESIIKIMGMPVNPDFLRPPTLSRKEFLTHLGLNSQTFTVCINAGWAGGGNMLQVFAALSQVKKPIQVIFLCGHNRELFEKAKLAAEQSSVPSAVLPFHDRLGDLMAACDLMVTKSGGLTTFEAIARRLPMAIDLIHRAMPQEEGTANMLIANKLGKPIYKPDDIVSIVEDSYIIKDRLYRDLPAAHCLDRVDAVYGIARIIFSSCNPNYHPSGEAAATRTFNTSQSPVAEGRD